jgi:hypothetical protein
MTVVTSGAGTAYPSGEHRFTPVLSGIRVGQYLVFYVVVFFYHGCLFLLFLLAIVLCVLQFRKKKQKSIFAKI